MSNIRRFNSGLRDRLELNIKSGLSIADISIILGVSRATVYKELALGLSAEDKEKRLWKNYSAELSQKNLERRVLEELRK